MLVPNVTCRVHIICSLFTSAAGELWTCPSVFMATLLVFFFQGAVETFPSVFVFSVANATKTNYFTRGWTISTLVVACKPKLSIRHSVEERENEKIQRRQMESCNSFGEVDMTNTYPAD